MMELRKFLEGQLDKEKKEIFIKNLMVQQFLKNQNLVQ